VCNSFSVCVSLKFKYNKISFFFYPVLQRAERDQSGDKSTYVFERIEETDFHEWNFRQHFQATIPCKIGTIAKKFVNGKCSDHPMRGNRITKTTLITSVHLETSISMLLIDNSHYQSINQMARDFNCDRVSIGRCLPLEKRLSRSN